MNKTLGWVCRSCGTDTDVDRRLRRGPQILEQTSKCRSIVWIGTTGNSSKLHKSAESKFCNCVIFGKDSMAISGRLPEYVSQRLSGILLKCVLT